MIRPVCGRRRRGSRGPTAHPPGVTLVELLIVVALFALLAGAAISLLSGGHRDTATEEAARQVAADIAYAQADALAHRAVRLVVFDEDADSYGLYSGQAALLTHPISKRPYQTGLAGLFAGAAVDLGTVDFGGSDTLRFDAAGVPAAGGTIEIHAAGGSWTVSVAGGSGRVTLEAGAGEDGGSLPEKDPDPIPEL